MSELRIHIVLLNIIISYLFSFFFIVSFLDEYLATNQRH